MYLKDCYMMVLKTSKPKIEIDYTRSIKISTISKCVFLIQTMVEQFIMMSETSHLLSLVNQRNTQHVLHLYFFFVLYYLTFTL